MSSIPCPILTSATQVAACSIFLCSKSPRARVSSRMITNPIPLWAGSRLAGRPRRADEETPDRFAPHQWLRERAFPFRGDERPVSAEEFSLLAIVPGLRQGPLDLRVIARPLQHLDPDIARKR